MNYRSFSPFIEGPVWVGSLGTLFFSDDASSPDERIWKLVPPSTTPEIFMEPSGSNGLAIDNLDQLVLADQKNKQIAHVDSSTAQAIGEASNATFGGSDRKTLYAPRALS